MHTSCGEKVFGEITLARSSPLQIRPAETARVCCPMCRSATEVPRRREPAECRCASCGMTLTHPTGGEPPGPQGPLDRWLAGEPIRARRLTGRERLRRWLAERPYLVGLSAVLLASLAAASILTGLAYRSACQRLHLATQELQQIQRQQEPAAAQPGQHLAADARQNADPQAAAGQASDQPPGEAQAPALEAAGPPATLR